MNYGLYLSATGAVSSMHKQDVHANNLANVNTVGFKPDIAVTRDRLPAREEGGHLPIEPKWLLEKLGGGHYVDPTRVSLAQGALNFTDNTLDVAISGDGFFVVEGQQLTRDGRFSLDADGTLVMAGTGKRVLGAENQPIHLDDQHDVLINTDGEISQGGRIVGRLQIVQPADPTSLQKIGHSLLRVDPNSRSGLTPATGRAMQGHVEASSVDPIMTMNSMINASKAVSSNATMMQYHDHIMDQAINTFGRVA